MARENGSKSVGNKPSIRHHLIPVVVWMLTLGTVVGLFYTRSQQITVFGLVQGQALDVATTCTGRVVGIKVRLFDHVRQGQTVAVMDIVPDNKGTEEHLKSQLQTVSAQIQHLTAQLVPTQEQLLSEAARTDTAYARDLRQFSADIDNGRLRNLELRAQIETDRMKAKALANDIAVERKLVDANAVVPTEMERLQMQYDTLQAAIRDNGALLDQAQKNLDLAQQRQTAFSAIAIEHPSVDHALEVIRKQIEAQERLMNEVSTQLDMLRSQQAFELKSPFDGIVSRIALGVGDVADVNTPIVKITQTNPTEVVGYVDQSQADQIREGMAVEIVRPGPPAVIGRAEVVSLGPTVEPLPTQLWRRPNVPQWGRAFLVKRQPK